MSNHTTGRKKLLRYCPKCQGHFDFRRKIMEHRPDCPILIADHERQAREAATLRDIKAPVYVKSCHCEGDSMAHDPKVCERLFELHPEAKRVVGLPIGEAHPIDRTRALEGFVDG